MVVAGHWMSELVGSRGQQQWPSTGVLVQGWVWHFCWGRVDSGELALDVSIWAGQEEHLVNREVGH